MTTSGQENRCDDSAPQSSKQAEEATQMRVVESQTPAARPQLDADLTRTVLAVKSCKIAVMQHRSVTAGADRKQREGLVGTDGAVVDCGDADLLIT
jgi:hypothetical protein